VTIELARAAQSGDDAAFVLLIEEHMAGMRAVAIALLGYVDEADDVVQDAVLTALRRLPELRDPAAAGPWLRRVQPDRPHRPHRRLRVRRDDAGID